MRRILITTANGMFGKAVATELLNKDVSLRLMVRDRSKCAISHPKAEIVTADLDLPETLPPVVAGVDSIFLTSPMDARLADRETALIKAARDAGVKQIARIYGTVRHEGDRLEALHMRVVEALKESGIPQIKISPGSVMETTMSGFADSIRYMRAIFGISGHSRICLVSVKDIAEATAYLMTTEGHEGKNHELTGPEAIDLYEVAARFSKGLGTKIRYVDFTEEKFSRFITRHDKSMTPERVDLEILCHLRAWKKGNAGLVTDTIPQLLGRKARSVDDFIAENREFFSKGIVPGFMAALMRMMI